MSGFVAPVPAGSMWQGRWNRAQFYRLHQGEFQVCRRGEPWARVRGGPSDYDLIALNPAAIAKATGAAL